MGFPQQKMPIPLVFRQMRQRELSAKLLAAAAENGDSSSQTIFYADQDGVVVYGSDGYESYTEDSLTPELFSTKASVVSFDSGAQTEPGNAVYRLVTDEQWEIAVRYTFQFQYDKS